MYVVVFAKPARPGNYLIKTELFVPDSSAALSSQGPNVLRKFQSICYFKRMTYRRCVNCFGNIFNVVIS